MKNFFTYPTAVLLGLGLLATPKADAQQFSKRKQYNSVSFGINAMNYFGDVTPNNNFTSFRVGATRPGVNVAFTHRFLPRISGRVMASYGRITGDDALAANQTDQDAKFRYHRNMNFRNDILEGSATVIFDLIENRNKFIKRPDFVPYLFAGVAVFHHNPQGADAGGAYVDLQPLKTEGQSSGYGLTQFSIPFGGGLRYRVSRNFDASLELGWRKTFTDYLDDVSGTYTDVSTLVANGPQSAYFGNGITRPDVDNSFPGFTSPGAARRGKSGNDWYVTTSLSLSYILTPKIKNPKFR